MSMKMNDNALDYLDRVQKGNFPFFQKKTQKNGKKA